MYEVSLMNGVVISNTCIRLMYLIHTITYRDLCMVCSGHNMDMDMVKTKIPRP